MPPPQLSTAYGAPRRRPARAAHLLHEARVAHGNGELRRASEVLLDPREGRVGVDQDPVEAPGQALEDAASRSALGERPRSACCRTMSRSEQKTRTPGLHAARRLDGSGDLPFELPLAERVVVDEHDVGADALERPPRAGGARSASTASTESARSARSRPSLRASRGSSSHRSAPSPPPRGTGRPPSTRCTSWAAARPRAIACMRTKCPTPERCCAWQRMRTALSAFPAARGAPGSARGSGCSGRGSSRSTPPGRRRRVRTSRAPAAAR